MSLIRRDVNKTMTTQTLLYQNGQSGCHCYPCLLLVPVKWQECKAVSKATTACTTSWRPVAKGCHRYSTVGLFKTATPDCRFVMTMIDCYSKWPEVAFVRDATTGTVHTFMSAVFSPHGIPLNLVTYNVVQFTYTFLTSFFQERQIMHHRLSLYYTPANGAIVQLNYVPKCPVGHSTASAVETRCGRFPPCLSLHSACH